MWAVSPRERSETPPLLRTSKMVMELWQGKVRWGRRKDELVRVCVRGCVRGAPLLRTSKMVMELMQGKMGSIINRSKFSGVLDDLLGRVLEGLLLGLLEVIIYMLEEYVISKAL